MVPRELTGRIAATLGAIVASNILVSLLIATLLRPWMAPQFDALGLEQPALQYVVATTVCFTLLVAIQLRYTRRELLAEADAEFVTAETHPEVLDRVTRLAAQLDMTPPTVAIADTAVANSFAIGGVRSGTIVLSRGLLETLEDAELEGVLAHELVHLKNADASVLTLASFLPALIADEHVVFGDHLPAWSRPYVYGGVVVGSYVLASSFIDAPLLSVAGMLQFGLTLGAILLVGGIALGILAAGIVHLSRGLSKQREFIADRDGARLTGNPGALASALERLDADEVTTCPSVDARESHSPIGESAVPTRGLEGMCFLPHGFDRGHRDADDDDQSGIETRAHPPTAERIAALGDLAASMERSPAVERR